MSNKKRQNSQTEIDIGLSLVGRGFFPETLPPCFTSAHLSTVLKKKRTEIRKIKFQNRAAAKPIRYSSTKNTGARRIFSTPHPLNYMLISEFIDDHWSIFEKQFTRKNSISASVPIFQPVGERRAVSIMSFGELNRRVHKTIKQAPYLLKTDIQQFYPSIYTHSIPWAVHGKSQAKTDRKRESIKIIFNELDYHVRNCQDGQTHGLFIGPDAARIISELILSAIDEKFLNEAKTHIIGAVRYVDDYYIGVESEAAASTVLSMLDEHLYDYELGKNDNKTRTIPTSLPDDSLWSLHLTKMVQPFKDFSRATDEQLMDTFNTALSYCQKFSSQSPIKYLLKQLDDSQIHTRDDFEFVEPYLMRIIHHYSHAIDYICVMVAARSTKGKSIDSDAWQQVIDNEISRYARLKQHQEVAWLLWLALMLKLKISPSVMEAILRTDNAHLVAMLISGYQSKLISHKPTLTPPKSLSMISEDWLTFHEAALAEMAKQSDFQNDELGIHSSMVDSHQGFIDYSMGHEELKKSNSVISGVRFGYEDDEGDDNPLDDFDDLSDV